LYHWFKLCSIVRTDMVIFLQELLKVEHLVQKII
jgi:hypothetical protein